MSRLVWTLIIVAGALLLVVGVFAPVVTNHLGESRSLWTGTAGYGKAVLGPAIAALVLAFTRWRSVAPALGIIAMLSTIPPLWKSADAVKDARAQEVIAQLDDPSFNPPDRDRMRWGWWPLVAGGVLVVTGGVPDVLEDRRREGASATPGKARAASSGDVGE